MQVQDLQNLVNYRRRDVTESFISNDEILEYLKEGNRKVGSEYEWNKVSTTFTYTDGSIRYAVSAIAPDFDETINLFYSPEQYFVITKPEDFMRLSAYDKNLMAIDGDYMLITTSFGTGDLTLNYYSNYLAKTSGGSRIANLSATTDEPLLALNDQDVLVDYAAARCYQKEGMLDDYAIAIKDFKSSLEKLQGKYPVRKRHYATIFKNTRRPGMSGMADKSNPLNQ
jgi:hypothetical protein